MDFLKTKFNNLMNTQVPPLKVKHLVIGTAIIVGVVLTFTSKNKTIVLVGNK